MSENRYKIGSTIVVKTGQLGGNAATFIRIVSVDALGFAVAM